MDNMEQIVLLHFRIRAAHSKYSFHQGARGKYNYDCRIVQYRLLIGFNKKSTDFFLCPALIGTQ